MKNYTHSIWPLVRLDECCKIVSGSTPKTSVENYWDGTVNWATPKDMGRLDSAYISDTERKITLAGLDSCGASLLPTGSVLLTSRAPIGHVALNTIPMATNQGFKSFVPKGSKIDAKYLYFWLKRNRDYLNSIGNGATFKEISKSTISKVQIPLPSLEDQVRIAHLLGKVEGLIAQRKKDLSQLDQFLKSVFLEMFGDPVSNENSQEITIGNALSKGILLLHKDGNHGSNYPRKEEFGMSGIPFITAKSIDDFGRLVLNNIEFLNETKANKLTIGWIEAGDVLLAHNATVGRVGYYGGNFEKALIGTSLTAYRPNRKYLTPLYLYEFLRSSYFQNQLFKGMGQATRNQVPITAQRELKIIIPLLSVQNEFASIVEKVESIQAFYQKSLSDLETLYAVLSQKAFQGELDLSRVLLK